MKKKLIKTKKKFKLLYANDIQKKPGKIRDSFYKHKKQESPLVYKLLWKFIAPTLKT